MPDLRRAPKARIGHRHGAKDYQTLAIAFGIFLATVILFSRGIWTPFFNYDDPIYVITNPHVTEGLSAAGFKWALLAGIRPDPPYDCGNWHPLTWLSLQADASLWGSTDFRGFHLTSVILHALNSALVFLFLNWATSRPLPGLLVALFWAWHPLRVESVTWISERKDVLSSFFFLLALLAYIRYTRAPRLWRYFLVALVFLAGLMAKPMVVTLPLVLLLLDYWPLRRLSAVEPALTGMALVVEKLPLLILAGASSLITIMVQRASGAMAAMEYFPVSIRLLNAGQAYVEYLWSMVYPLSLAPLYPLRYVSVLGGMMAWLPIVLLTVAALRTRKRHRSVMVGWLWYLIMLVPVIGLVQVGYQSRADRYTYLPMIGVLVAIVFGVAGQEARPKASPGSRKLKSVWSRALTLIVCLALLLLAGATWQEQGHWDNSLRIWEHALELVGPDALIEYQAGEASQRQAALAAAELDYEKRQSNLTSAEAHYRKAIQLAPTYADAYVNLGSVLLSGQRPTAALPYLEEAVRLKPTLVGPHRNLGLAYLKLKRFDEAENHYRQELQLDPSSPELWEWLGIVQFQAVRYDDAFESFARAAKLRPQTGLYYAECAHARRPGHEDEARQIYNRSFRVDAAWARHTAEEIDRLLKPNEPDQRDNALAAFLAETLCEATARLDAGYLELLSRSQAANGDYVKAAATLKEAIDLKPTLPAEVKTEWSARLRQYKVMQNQPGAPKVHGKTNTSR